MLRRGLPPAPQHASQQTWRSFLRSQAHTLLACDFMHVETVFLKRLYVFFARNLFMDLGSRAGCFWFLLRDRDSKFTAAFDGVFVGNGTAVIPTPPQSQTTRSPLTRTWQPLAKTDELSLQTQANLIVIPVLDVATAPEKVATPSRVL
ncbi:hypothetical protein AB0M05_29920 [Streptomyces violaceusniger]|uniref:hypothetical protein n=1 Tax=Streptomyces violaceusniger TaxID=68280 RepID=UPI003420C3EA